ncbi:MAG: gliding motility-associated C-terminal domain-containing protein [Bacteroidales bacterium]|nr:gliding motility-associated C-terminal domain-containing protein [Bacteroidales bacterium]
MTGAITPSTSAASTYTVTYTIAAAGGCGVVTATTSVTINALPNNTFTISDPTVCFFENAIINVSSSEIGVTYVLQDNTNLTVAGPVNGTGTAISFTLNANTLTVGTFNYHVVATTATGCSLVLPDLAIVTKRAEVTFTFTSTNVTCNGLSDGKINVTAANGNAPYTVSIDNGLTFPYSSGADIIVGTGNYQIIVKDANNCLSAMQSVTIIEPSALAATASVTNIVCYGATDGIIDITATGGTTPYQYSIDGGVTFFAINTFNSLAAGTYNIVVKDFNSCTFATTATITEPLSPPLDNIIVTDIKCYGESTGAIQMIPNLVDYTGPFQYSIDGGVTYTTTDKFTGLPKGVYTVFYKSGAGTCIYSDVAPVGEPPEISVTSLNKTDLVCGGAGDGSITVTAISFNVVNDPLTVKYSIDGGPYGLSGTFIGLSGGDHIVSMINDSLCVKNITVNLSEPASITLSTPVVTNISCFAAPADGSISVTASGGVPPYIYTLKQGAATITSNGVGLFTGLSAGSYTVEVNDAGTCPPIISGVLTIVEPPAISITGQTFEDIKCFGGTATITVSAVGGTNSLVYNLYDGTHSLVSSNGTGNFAPSIAGTYTVEVTDANSCGPQIAGPFIITMPAELKIVSQSFTQITAAGASDGTITILATGGTGTSLIYTLNPLDPLNPMAGFALTPGVGIPAVFTGLSADTYTVVVIDDNSCTVVSAPVVLGMINIDLTATQTTCKKTNDGQISLSIIGGNAPYTITWAGRTLGSLPAFDNLTSITGLAPDWYIAKVVDFDGLSIKDSILITDPKILTVSIDTARCSYLKETRDDVGRIEILSTTRGIGSDLTFKWNYPPSNPNTGLVIDSISSGNYKVTVTDAGCAYDSSFYVPYDPKYYMNAYAVKDTNICYGVSLDLKAKTNGPLNRTYTYSWYKIPETAGVPLSTNTTFRISPKDSSKYYLEIRNDGFCFSSDTVKVGVYPKIGLHVPLYISAIQEDTIISILSGTTYNMDVNVANTQFPTTFRWEPSIIFIPPDSWNSEIYIDDASYSQLPKVEIFDPKIRRNSTYVPIKAIAETSVGCSDTLNLYAKLVNKISFGNVFSPNGDGNNDTWKVPKEYLFPDLEIEIFNRWGALVWSAKGDKAAKGWDGRTNGGNELPIGTYYYVIKYNIQTSSGNWKPITGSITIVR